MSRDSAAEQGCGILTGALGALRTGARWGALSDVAVPCSLALFGDAELAVPALRV